MKNFDILNIKVLSAISYLGPLFIIGRFSVEKDSDNFKFHSKQGEFLFYTMFIIFFITWSLEKILYTLFDSFSIIFILIYIGIFTSWIILSILGIYGSFNNKKIKLPFIEFLIK